jgi:mannose-6-phosphate isomerase-like protein (cupin superfamily)
MIQRSAGLDEFWTPENCYVTEWWNTPDDPAVSVARIRVAEGQTTRWHTLRGTAERYVVLSGEGQVETASCAGPVSCGDVVFIGPGERQRITNTGDGDLIFLALCTPRFQPDVYADVDEGDPLAEPLAS